MNLGDLYRTGDGVAKDYGEAARWYHKPAEHGYAHAQYNLGMIYCDGQGVPQRADDNDLSGAPCSRGDSVRAYAWINLAAAHGHQKAAEVRANVERYMTWHQIAEAQQLSRELVD